QAGDDEGAVADSIDLGHARTDGRAEHDEIEGCRDHRRHNALQQRAPGARHLKVVNRTDGIKVHGLALTRFTKISARELSRVWRSLKSILSSPSFFSRRAIPVRSRCASKV